MDEITQQNTGDLIFCPVRSWAKVVKRIKAIPGTTQNTHVNVFEDENGKAKQVSGNDVKTALRAAALVMGEDVLGFKSSEVGTHSIRSGAAMAMYLDGVPVYSIMLLGRWSSDAFLRYIQKQVEQFSPNVSKRMIKNQHFTHVPQAPQYVSRHDPRQRNHRDNFQTRRNMGGNAGAAAQLPSFALWS